MPTEEEFLQLQGEVEQLRDNLTRNTWAGGNILRDEFPRMYTVTAESFSFMTANEGLRGAFFLVLGDPGDADVIYLCRKNAADAYEFDAIN